MSANAFDNLEDPPPDDGRIRPPAVLRSRYAVRDRRIVVAMPANALFLGCLPLWILAVLGVIGFLAYIFIDSKGNWIPVGVFGAVGSLILGVFYAGVAPERTTIEVDPDRLAIAKRGLIFGSRREYPAGQVRNVFLRHNLVVVILPGEPEALGVHLSDDERKWIQLILCRVLRLPLHQAEEGT